MAYMDHKDLANSVVSEQRAQVITDGVHRVQDRIARAAGQADRDPATVTLLAATKTRDVGEIMAALRAGIRTIGENRPQEITAKVAGLSTACAAYGWQYGAVLSAEHSMAEVCPEHRTHTKYEAHLEFTTGAEYAIHSELAPYNEVEQCYRRTVIDVHTIGQLQKNKINKILPVVTTIESVDSVQLAQQIAKRLAVLNEHSGVCRTVGVLLEVNESGESSKSGCDPEAAQDIAYEIAQVEGLQLQGFMTIGAHVDDERVIRSGFAHLRATRDAVVASGESGTAYAQTLSMGMSGDLDYAIQEGSTLVRVGTAIFGERAFI